MIKLQKNWPYLLLIISALVLIVSGLLFPKIDHHLNWLITCLALLCGALPFTHSVLKQKQEKSANRPNLTGWVSKISESTKGTPQVSFTVIVKNTGSQDTELTGAFLILEGHTKDNASSLLVCPTDAGSTKIAARSQKSFWLEDRGHKIADYCNPKGTIYLRDATNREYPIRVGKIVPGTRVRRISDLPVRED